MLLNSVGCLLHEILRPCNRGRLVKGNSILLQVLLTRNHSIAMKNYHYKVHPDLGSRQVSRSLSQS